MMVWLDCVVPLGPGQVKRGVGKNGVHSVVCCVGLYVWGWFTLFRVRQVALQV